jgi:uncharacterized protein DUF3618
MTEHTTGAEPERPLSVDEARADIAQQREELGETVAALAHRADVKARYREGRDRAVDRTEAVARQAVAAVEARWPAGVAAVRRTVAAAEDRWPEGAAAVRRSPETAAAVAAGTLLLALLVIRGASRRNRRA